MDNGKQSEFLATAVAAALLLFSVAYLTRCSSPPPRVAPPTATSASGTAAKSAVREEEGEGKSIKEFAAEEDKEERQKVENVAHALQTLGANPEFRKTYGLPK